MPEQTSISEESAAARFEPRISDRIAAEVIKLFSAALDERDRDDVTTLETAFGVRVHFQAQLSADPRSTSPDLTSVPSAQRRASFANVVPEFRQGLAGVPAV